MVGWLAICVNNPRTFQAFALKLLVNHIKINIIFIIIFVQVQVGLLKYINNDDDDDDDNEDDNNNNGNFICVFERTIVNLATYREFTNAAWDWIIEKRKQKQKQNKTNQKPIIIIRVNEICP